MLLSIIPAQQGNSLVNNSEPSRRGKGWQKIPYPLVTLSPVLLDAHYRETPTDHR